MKCDENRNVMLRRPSTEEGFRLPPHTFLALDDECLLDANTTYYVFLDDVNVQAHDVQIADDVKAEDDPTGEGWQIGNGTHIRANSWREDTGSGSIRIRLWASRR